MPDVKVTARATMAEQLYGWGNIAPLSRRGMVLRAMIRGFVRAALVCGCKDVEISYQEHEYQHEMEARTR